jgi:PIN domain nuclease of toxin-antitoxin system
MVLLDTHALLWLDSGAPMTRESIAVIDDAAARGEVLVSPISAWEIGLLARKGRLRLDLDPLVWFERFLGLPGVRLTPLTAPAAILPHFSLSHSTATPPTASLSQPPGPCQQP